MKFLWRYVLVVAALVAGSLLLVACGGEEELSLDQYFRRSEDIWGAVTTRVKTLEEETEGLWEDVEATQDFLDGVAAILKEGLNDLEDIHPPGEARDAHDEFVAALSDWLPLWENLSDRLADLESPSELEAQLAGLEDEASWEAASERWGNACLQLEGTAEQNGIEVDLACGGEEEEEEEVTTPAAP